MPFDEWMQLAFGQLQLSPEVFWQMTLMEFAACMRGYQRRHGGGSNPQEEEEQNPNLAAKLDHFFTTREIQGKET